MTAHAQNPPLQIKVKRLPHAAGVPLPTRMTAGAAGFDVCAALAAPVTLAPGDVKLIPCGFAIAVPPGYEAQLRPRSGLSSKSGITLINTPGTIDSDYRGEVHAPLVNLSRNPFTVEPGTRVAQMVICPVPAVELLEVPELDETPRGAGGFGHTGR